LRWPCWPALLLLDCNRTPERQFLWVLSRVGYSPASRWAIDLDLSRESTMSSRKMGRVNPVR
jgi:hypothetical protein